MTKMYSVCALGAALTIFGAAGTAHASSTTEPGFTTGIPLYAAHLPVGLYVDIAPDLSVRNTNPDTTFKAITPFFVLQTPLEVAGARIMLVAAAVYGDLRVKNQFHIKGFYNTYVGAQGTWDIGNNWGLGIRVAGWIPQGGDLALRYGTIAPRIGVTKYTATEHFTASLERGYTIERKRAVVGPNYLNLDLTYTRTFKKAEVGIVGFISTDTNRPLVGYRKQSQAAIGPLIGYSFKGVQVQGKFTTDVYQKNYGGREKRAEFNITIPLWMPRPASSPGPSTKS